MIVRDTGARAVRDRLNPCWISSMPLITALWIMSASQIRFVIEEILPSYIFG